MSTHPCLITGVVVYDTARERATRADLFDVADVWVLHLAGVNGEAVWTYGPRETLIGPGDKVATISHHQPEDRVWSRGKVMVVHKAYLDLNRPARDYIGRSSV
jgi:hypothetical protein